MSDLDPEARDLLQSARAQLEPSGQDCARMDRALTERLGLPLGTIATSAPAGSIGPAAAVAVASSAGVPLAGAGKIAATVLLLAGLGAGGAHFVRSPRATSAPHATSAAPVASVSPVATVSSAEISHAPASPIVEAPATVPPIASEEAPAAPALSVNAPPAPWHARASERHAVGPSAVRHPDVMLGAETRLLRKADEMLRLGDPAAALALLDEHARTFPLGALSEERSAERVLTLCALGRDDEARTEARAFLATRADSPLAAVVRASCSDSASHPNSAR